MQQTPSAWPRKTYKTKDARGGSRGSLSNGSVSIRFIEEKDHGEKKPLTCLGLFSFIARMLPSLWALYLA